MRLVERVYKRVLREYTNRLVSDRKVIRRHYRQQFGRFPDLANPVTFSEKIQWLKLNYRRPELHQMVDKYAVRQYVQERVGEQFLNELIGVWNDAVSIGEGLLPERFVIKATHGSGMNVICRGKEAIDWSRLRWQLSRWLESDYYLPTREWAYKGVQPRLVCEAFLESAGNALPDYKVFCFNGEPKIIQVDEGRLTTHTRTMLNLKWESLPFELYYPAPEVVPKQPANLQEMIDIARTLSDGLPFCRVDLYSVEGRTIFGEMTMYPGNGMAPFRPSEWDRRLGDWLTLPR